MRRAPIAIFVLTMALTACASGSSGSSAGSRGGDRNLITAEELANVGASNAYDAIVSLRGRWLRARSGSASDLPATFVDGSHRGDYQALGSISLVNVQEIRYLDARDATTLYGTGYPGGVINVITR